MAKYYLGIDLGIKSIGWSVSKDENNITTIDDFGVIIWDTPFDNTKSGTVTHNEIRRGHRASRRRQDRKRWRKIKTHNLLNNYLKSCGSKLTYDNLRQAENKLRNFMSKKSDFEVSPYVLKVKGLTKKLTDLELGTVLLHYINHRGYNNLFDIDDIGSKEDKKEMTEEEKKIAKKKEEEMKGFHKGTINSEALKEKYPSLTPSEIVLKEFKIRDHNETGKGDFFLLRNSGERVGNKESRKEKRDWYIFQRQDLKKECEKILQISLQESNFKENIIEKILSTVFDQLPFEAAPGIGNTPEKREEYRFTEAIKIRKELKNIQDKNPLGKGKVRSEEVRGKILHLQRKLYALTHYVSPKELKENCLFYPKEKRGFKSSVIYDLFNMVVEVSKFVLLDKKQEDIKVFTNKCYDLFFDLKGIVSKDKIKKIYIEVFGENPEKLYKENKVYDNISIKSEYSKFISKLDKTYRQKWITYPTKNTTLEDIEKLDLDLGLLLNEFSTPIEIHNRLKKRLGDDYKMKVEDFKKELKTFSTTNTSMKWMIEAIKAFKDGKRYGNFQEEKGQELINSVQEISIPRNERKLFSLEGAKSLQRNSTVYSSICQLRHFIKKAYNRWGDFEKIIVEVGTGFKLTSEEKNININRIRANEKEWREIDKLILDNNLRTSAEIKQRVFLWKQQGEKSILSGKPINIKKIANNSYVERDHIFPQSRLSIHNNDNRILILHDENQEKKNMTPLQYIRKNHPEWEEDYHIRVNTLGRDLSKPLQPSKLKVALLKTSSMSTSDLQKFIGERQASLNDTRYIAKFFKNWLSEELTKKYFLGKENFNPGHIEFKKQKDLIRNGKVLEVTGLTTSHLRRLWLKDSPWGQQEKVRDISPWHHAIDGSVLSLIRNYMDKEFYSTFVNAKRVYRDIKREKRQLKKTDDWALEKFKHSVEEYKQLLIDSSKAARVGKQRVRNYEDDLDRLIACFKNDGKLDEIVPNVGSNPLNLTDFFEKEIPVKLEIRERFLIANDLLDLFRPLLLSNKKMNDALNPLKSLFSSFDDSNNWLDGLINFLEKNNVVSIICDSKTIKEYSLILNNLTINFDEKGILNKNGYIDAKYKLLGEGLKTIKEHSRDNSIEDQLLFIKNYIELFIEMVEKIESNSKKKDKVKKVHDFVATLEDQFKRFIFPNKEKTIPTSTSINLQEINYNGRFIKFRQDGKISSQLTSSEITVKRLDMIKYWQSYLKNASKEEKEVNNSFKKFLNNERKLQSLNKNDSWLWTKKDIFIDKNNNPWKLNKFYGLVIQKHKETYKALNRIRNIDVKAFIQNINENQILLHKGQNYYFKRKFQRNGEKMDIELYLNYTGLTDVKPTFLINGLNGLKSGFSEGFDFYGTEIGTVPITETNIINKVQIDIFGRIN